MKLLFICRIRAVHCSAWTGTGLKTGLDRTGPDQTVHNRSGPRSYYFPVSVFDLVLVQTDGPMDWTGGPVSVKIAIFTSVQNS